MRKCPRCHKEMKENCYLKDQAPAISAFALIEKKEDYKKIEYPLKAGLCKSCGYVEFYVDIDKE